MNARLLRGCFAIRAPNSLALSCCRVFRGALASCCRHSLAVLWRRGQKSKPGWPSRLAWLAPAPVPSGGSTERLKAVSLALASARQSLDKLSTEINRLEVQGADSGPSRTVIPTGQARQSAQPSACAHRCSSLIVTTHGFLLTREDEDDGQNNDDRR